MALQERWRRQRQPATTVSTTMATMMATRRGWQLQREGLRGQEELPYGLGVLNLVFTCSLVIRSPRRETTPNFMGVINLFLGYLAVYCWGP